MYQNIKSEVWSDNVRSSKSKSKSNSNSWRPHHHNHHHHHHQQHYNHNHQWLSSLASEFVVADSSRNCYIVERLLHLVRFCLPPYVARTKIHSHLGAHTYTHVYVKTRISVWWQALFNSPPLPTHTHMREVLSPTRTRTHTSIHKCRNWLPKSICQCVSALRVSYGSAWVASTWLMWKSLNVKMKKFI